MSATTPNLLLTTSPFLKQQEDTGWIMWQVNYSLIPVVLVAVYYFGMHALLVLAAAVAGALLPEGLLARAKGTHTLRDGSAVITGVLLALTLPPSIPLWMAFVGGFIGVAMGKLLFGGIGYTLFNPALVGRSFLQAAFPVAMTTWIPNVALKEFVAVSGSTFALPFLKPTADVVTEATPLAQMKFATVQEGLPDLMIGATSGSLGETGGAVILLCGLYLAVRQVLNWRIPVSIFLSVFVLTGILHWVDPTAYASPQFHLFSGGLILGAVYMATDPVTSPNSQVGCWIFGVAIGILVVVIRTFGGLPEGVMFAILLMNAASPLINRFTQPRIYGTRDT